MSLLSILSTPQQNQAIMHQKLPYYFSIRYFNKNIFDRRSDLTGVDIEVNSWPLQDYRYFKQFKELLLVFQEKFNFTIKWRPNSKYGTCVNNSCNGIMKQLVNYEIDVTILDFTHTFERIAYASPGVQSSLSIFAQKYLCKCERTYFILQNKHLCIYKDSF